MGRRTRAQAKAQEPADIERESTHVATPVRNKGKKAAVEKEVTSSYRAPTVKPTCSKLLNKAVNGVPPGSINAYLALREQQKLSTTPQLQEDDVPELNVDQATDEEEAVKGTVYMHFYSI